MRLVDLLLRHGHVSDRALTEAILTGDRPRHLDSCDLCGDRAVELSRWLDEIRAMATAEVDAAFPPERLAAQQTQILRRLEQADAPPRVIEFPRQNPAPARASGGRRVAPAWVGVAAAAGVIVGVVGTEFAAKRTVGAAPASSATVAAPAPAAQAPGAPVSAPDRPADRAETNASLFEMDLEGYTPDSLRVFDEATPRLVQTRLTSANVR